MTAAPVIPPDTRRNTVTQPEPTNEPTGLHGLDFGDGFLAVFCERENLLATYPHQCPADEPAFPTDAESERAAAETRHALDFQPFAAGTEWVCQGCGYHNNGGICTHCGRLAAGTEEG